MCLLVSLSCRNIDDVDKTLDEINEQTENMRQIQDALSQPTGAAAELDEVRCCLCAVQCTAHSGVVEPIRTVYVPRLVTMTLVRACGVAAG